MKSKRILFDKMDKWTNGLLILLALICVSVGIFELFPNLSPEWTKRISAFGYVFLIIHFGKMFVRPNYVGWNKQGMNIRIKSFIGESLSYKDIKSMDLENGILKITKIGGQKIEFDLNGIETEDIDRIKQILLENTIASNGI